MVEPLAGSGHVPVVESMKGDDELVDKVADAAVCLVRPIEIVSHRFASSIIEAGRHTLFALERDDHEAAPPWMRRQLSDMVSAVPALPDGVVAGPDGLPRCWWCVATDEYRAYHDAEWGRPVTDDHRLFEKICLEGFQAGLSWLTILRKREAFRSAFAGFDFNRIARFSPRRVETLLANAAIVRHRGKIESTINNARRARELVGESGSLANYFWRWQPEPASRPTRITRAALVAMSTTPGSIALSRDLKRRGWTFVGPTTIYAFMQAMGLVNDHVEGCFVRDARRTGHVR